MADDVLARLTPAAAEWMRRAHGAPTPAQARAIPRILDGEHLLLSSPTGSGKTLAAFLGILSELQREPPDAPSRGVRCVYVSPLRALVSDVARNLQRPLEGIERLARLWGEPVRPVGVALRTGDTPPAERARQVRSPPDVLATTPESLALLLASPRARGNLRHVRWVVVDEVHALAGTKRGDQLALSLERLAHHAGEFQRIGLSATVAPLERVARWLCGPRACRVEHVAPAGVPDLEVRLPMPDPLRASDDEVEEATLALVRGIMEDARTTLVFTGSRRHAERVAHRLRAAREDAEVDLADDEPPVEEDASVDPEFGAPERAGEIAAHHGSLSRETRAVVEERLKRGELRCVVASSSLELGVHVESVDHVVLLGSPKEAARTLQRVGRSGHSPGATSRATLVMTDPGELAEAFALRGLVRERRIEPVETPSGALDVLAQHVLAMALDGPTPGDDAFALTRRAAPYDDLAREDFEDVVEHLAECGLVVREGARIVAPPGERARLVYLTHAGTIPDGGLLRVFHDDRYVGEVDEAFAETLQPHDTFLLAGHAWRYLRAVGTRVVVVPARGAAPALPTWRGESLAMSPLLATATAQTLAAEPAHDSNGEDDTEYQLARVLRFQAAFGAVPTPEECLVEAFPDDEGTRTIVFHAPLGRRATEALARALARRLSDELDEAPVRPVAHDLGFALRAPRRHKPTLASLRRLLRAPLELDLRRALAAHELLRRRFRHVATRGLLLLRREGQTLTERQREANALLQRLPDAHPLVREAWRECLHGALRLDEAEAWRADVAAGRRPLRLAPARPCASPLAARIVAREGDEGRREALRDNLERVQEWLEYGAKAED